MGEDEIANADLRIGGGPRQFALGLGVQTDMHALALKGVDRRHFRVPIISHFMYAKSAYRASERPGKRDAPAGL